MVEIYTQLYIHLSKHKIPHSFDHCDCIVFRLYSKLLSTHGPNLAYCAIFLNKLVNLYLKEENAWDIILELTKVDFFLDFFFFKYCISRDVM